MRVYPLPFKKRKFNVNFSLTTWLIIVNIFVFIILLFFSKEFVETFVALDPFYVLRAQSLWTFISSMFMHAGFFHLFVNMLSLFFVGSLVEKILGRKRYLWFYLLSGIFASLFFVLFYFISGNFNLNVPAVGASGALFGLIGLLMILTPNLKVYAMFIPIPIKMKYAAPGLLILLWIVSLVGKINIGNTAHLGGLVVGIIYGIYLIKKYPNKTKYISRHFS